MQRTIFLIYLFCSVTLALPVLSQVTSVYNDADLYYIHGSDLFEKGNFGLAKAQFEKARHTIAEQFDERSILLQKKALLMEAKAALWGEFPDGEKLIMDFYQTNSPDPLAYSAIKEIGNLKYNKKLYSEAILYYNKIDLNQLTKADKTEVLFKRGYAHFVKKDFNQAEKDFFAIIGEPSNYLYPTYYYMGMVKFFKGDYDAAVDHFFKIENHELYKSRIPYYIAQIYFAQQEYDKIIAYVPIQLKDPQLENVKEIRHILGQTYFIKKDYAEALPHLEFYEKNSPKMRKEDFYQLAFTQYQLKLYAKAAENFKELSILDTRLGQISNHYLADCYLRIGNKEEARVSFKNVLNYKTDLDLLEEAKFNYGKLSAELGYDRPAIATLLEITETSRFYNEAQQVLGELFESSRDYGMVIQTIENIPNQSPRIREAYQKVCLERGIQLINDGQRNEAKIILIKGSKNSVNNFYTALINFHIADIAHQEGDYDGSINHLNKYYTLQTLVQGLPYAASVVMADYLQAYNFLKKEEYPMALTFFEKSMAEMRIQGFQQSEDLRKRRLFADVVSRIADCYFTFNNYGAASDYYQLASTLDFPGRDYAYFQHSMIKGLEGKPFEKIVILEDLIKIVPGSSFLDDAYFQIGETQFSLGNSREAEQSYVKILNMRERSTLITRALLKLGLIAYNRGDTNKATTYYTDIFKNNPNKTEAQEALIALEEIYIQDLGEAETFMKIVEENTGYKLSNLERDSLSYMAAEGRFNNGEYIEAINSYTRYIDNYPNGFNRLRAIYNRAESNSYLKNYSKALPDYERIIISGQNEYYEDAIYKAALISYNDLKEFDKSFNYYSLLEDVTSDRLLKYEAQMGALRSAFRAGNSTAIVAISEKVMNNELANKDDKALAYFLSGKVHYLKKSWDLALPNLNEAISLADNANAAEAKFLINDIYFQQGNYELAESSTMETISNSSSYPYWVAKNLLLISDIFFIKKDLFNAKAAVEAVIENFPENEEITSQANEKLIKILEEEAKLSRIEENTETIKLDTTGNYE